MTYREAVNKFFLDKRTRAFNLIKSTVSTHELNDARISLAKSRATLVAPSLDIANRSTRAVKEIPTYRPVNVMVEMGKAYEGVEVTIPVKGDITLFTTFINNRSICDGFTIAGNAIKVKQYDFSGAGVGAVKAQIKSCVDSLEYGLSELKDAVVSHHNDLDVGVANAVTARKNELTNQAQRDKDSDPWG